MKKSHYKDNPLIGNYPKTKSQEENYTTEALASLLSYMVNNDRKFASRFLGLLTSSKFNLRNYNSTDVKIRTQVRTSKGTPDIEISTPDFLIYIEVKVEARLNDNQIERYKSLLRHSGKSNSLLVLISKYRVWFYEEPDCYIRWLQIANWLEKEIANTKPSATDILVSQFLDFLQYRYIICTPVRKRISPSLRRYLQRQGEKSLAIPWMMRSSAIGDDPDLASMRNLIDIMALAIEKAYPNTRFAFNNNIGIMSRTLYGIGFGIDYMYYFFFKIRKPEFLIFTLSSDIYRTSASYRIDPTKFRGGVGKLLKYSGKSYWMNTLDLTEKNMSFFAKSLDEQVRILSEFLKKSQKALSRLLVEIEDYSVD